MPILQCVLEPAATANPIKVILSHAIRSQVITLTRVHVIKAGASSYDDNYYRLKLPFLTSSRQSLNNKHNGNIIVANQPGVRSFEVAFDCSFTADNIPETFDCQVQQKDGTLETSSTLKAIILTFDYRTNKIYHPAKPTGKIYV